MILAHSQNTTDNDKETTPNHPDKPAPQRSGEFKAIEAKVLKLIQEEKTTEAVALARNIPSCDKFAPPWRRCVLLSKALEAAGQRSNAIAMLASFDLPVQGRLALAEMHVRDGNHEDALCVLPTSSEIEILPPRKIANFLLRRAKVLMDIGNIADSGFALDTAVKTASLQHTIKFWLDLAELGVANGRVDASLEALHKTVTSNVNTSGQMRRALKLFRTIVRSNHKLAAPDDLMFAFEKFVVENPSDIKFLLLFTRLLPHFSRTDRALKLLEGAPVSNMNTAEQVSYAQTQLAIGATLSAAKTASEILANEDIEHDQKVKISIVRARCLAIEERYVEAAALLQGILSVSESLQVERLLLMLVRKIGSQEQLSSVVNEIRRSRAQSLPLTLAEGLASIAPVKGPLLRNAPMSLVVPWKLSGRPEQDWTDWSSLAQWGKTAGALLARWGHYAGMERRQELLDLIDPIDETPLIEALSLGRGVILFGTHMGPVASVFFALEENWDQFAFVGAGGTPSSTRASEILLSGSGNHGSVKKMIQHLKSNGILAVANDAVSSGDMRRMNFAGYDCKMSRIAPRLSRTQSAPSLWFQAEWVGNRIHVQFKSMPRHEPGEPATEWEDRWYAACEVLVTSYTATAAENQSGFSMYLDPLARRADEWWGG